MKITVADLFPDAQGMILVAQDAFDGSAKHISEVPNGAACGCICFGCKKQLIAKNGGDPSKVAHHFAHRAEDLVFDCVSAGETALHIRAKEIIAQHRRVTLPAGSIRGIDNEQIEVSPQRSVALTDVRLEAIAGELIPDVTATMPDGRRIFIEIANTHPCSPEKIMKLDAMGVDVLEIMVAGYRDVPLDELDYIILDIAPRHLIHSVELKAMSSEIAAEQKRRDEAKRAEGQRLVEVYRDPAIRNHIKAQALTNELVELGLANYINLEDDRPSAFVMYRRQWQAAVFDRLYKSQSSYVKPIDLLRSFTKGDWPKPELAYITSEHSHWIAANISEDFKSPYQELTEYLLQLQKRGAVREARGKGFAMNNDLVQFIASAIEKQNRPKRRAKELVVIFKDIGSFMSVDDGRMPEFNQWLKGRAGAFNLSLEDLLVDESGKYDALAETIRNIRWVLGEMARFKNIDLTKDIAGLPIDRLINRLKKAVDEEERREQAEWAALREKQKREDEELQQKEKENRVLRLREAAKLLVPNVEVFLDTPLREHDHQTPRQLAFESYKGFNQAQAILAGIKEANRITTTAENIKQDMIGKLWERIHASIPRREIAELWTKSRWRELSNQTPLEYCKDQKTLAFCVELLEVFVANERKKKRL